MQLPNEQATTANELCAPSVERNPSAAPKAATKGLRASGTPDSIDDSRRNGSPKRIGVLVLSLLSMVGCATSRSTSPAVASIASSLEDGSVSTGEPARAPDSTNPPHTPPMVAAHAGPRVAIPHTTITGHRGLDDSQFPLKAVTLANTSIPYGDPRLEPLVNEIRLRGADTVTLLNSLYQEQWDEPGKPIDSAENAKSVELRQQIRMAKQAGLKVILKASMTTYEGVNHWHGQVRMRNVQAWRDWFDNYTVYLSAMARLTSEEQADGLILGNELKAIAATRTDDASLERYLVELSYYLLDPHPVTHKPYAYEQARALDALEMTLEVGLELALEDGESNRPIRDLLEHDLRDPEVVERLLLDPDDRAAIKEAITLERNLLYQHWLSLIRTVRAISKDRVLLSYAANFDNFDNIRFWPELDFVGINAYFDADPTGEQRFIPNHQHLRLFREGWQEVVDKIDAFRIASNLNSKPLVFTELGYVNLHFSATQGWNYGQEPLVVWRNDEPEILSRTVTDRPLDLQERADIFQAIADTNKPDPWLDGVMLWRVNTLPERNPHTTVEPFSLFVFEPHVDPAEASIRDLFSALDPERPMHELDEVAVGLEVLFSFLSDEQGLAAPTILNEWLRRRQEPTVGVSAALTRTQFMNWASQQSTQTQESLARSGWVLQALKDAVEFGIRRVVEEHPKKLRPRRARFLVERFLIYLEEECMVEDGDRRDFESWLLENLISPLLDKKIRTRSRWPVVQRAVLYLEGLIEAGTLQLRVGPSGPRTAGWGKDVSLNKPVTGVDRSNIHLKSPGQAFEIWPGWPTHSN